MGGKNGGGVPKGHNLSYAEIQKLQHDFAEATAFIQAVGFRLTYSFDIVSAALARLFDSGKLTPQLELQFKTQIRTIQSIMKGILQIPQEAVDAFRKIRNAEEFEIAVTKLVDVSVPPLVTGANMREMHRMGDVFLNMSREKPN
jgi:hypothetical protein